MTYEPEHLRRWTMPDSYFGAQWPDYYSAGFGQSRDSDELEQSNFAVCLRELGGESETIIVVEEGHWAVGWVQWIAIHESDARALQIADKLKAAYEDYPVLDESDWSEREWNAACSAWEAYSIRDRAELCARAGVSIFAARRDSIPEDDSGYIQQLLLGH